MGGIDWEPVLVRTKWTADSSRVRAYVYIFLYLMLAYLIVFIDIDLTLVPRIKIQCTLNKKPRNLATLNKPSCNIDAVTDKRDYKTLKSFINIVQCKTVSDTQQSRCGPGMSTSGCFV